MHKDKTTVQSLTFFMDCLNLKSYNIKYFQYNLLKLPKLSFFLNMLKVTKLYKQLLKQNFLKYTLLP